MRLIPERRILLYVGAMMGGVALAIIWRDLCWRRLSLPAS